MALSVNITKANINVPPQNTRATWSFTRSGSDISGSPSPADAISNCVLKCVLRGHFCLDTKVQQQKFSLKVISYQILVALMVLAEFIKLQVWNYLKTQNFEKMIF